MTTIVDCQRIIKALRERNAELEKQLASYQAQIQAQQQVQAMIPQQAQSVSTQQNQKQGARCVVFFQNENRSLPRDDIQAALRSNVDGTIVVVINDLQEAVKFVAPGGTLFVGAWHTSRWESSDLPTSGWTDICKEVPSGIRCCPLSFTPAAIPANDLSCKTNIGETLSVVELSFKPHEGMHPTSNKAAYTKLKAMI